jgi:hypothetical protein
MLIKNKVFSLTEKSEERGFCCQRLSGTLIFRFYPAAWHVTYSSQKMEKLFWFSAEL